MTGTSLNIGRDLRRKYQSTLFIILMEINIRLNIPSHFFYCFCHSCSYKFPSTMHENKSAIQEQILIHATNPPTSTDKISLPEYFSSNAEGLLIAKYSGNRRAMKYLP